MLDNKDGVYPDDDCDVFRSKTILFSQFFPVQAASWLKVVAALNAGTLAQLNFQFKQGLYKGSDAVQNLHIDVINQPSV